MKPETVLVFRTDDPAAEAEAVARYWDHLRKFSSFYGVAERTYYGADYDIEYTNDHHTGERHEYAFSGTALNSGIVINLPKLKTHKKAGVTLSLKNLVGLNTDKNLLPH